MENWQSRHFKTLQSAYNRSPYFDHYQDELDNIYRQPFDRLADWNMYCLDWLKKKLNWTAEIRFTEKEIPFNAEGFDDRRTMMVPKNYGRWNPVKYRQTFEERTGFIPNLSVLDLLFNEGPKTGELLRNSSMRV